MGTYEIKISEEYESTKKSLQNIEPLLYKIKEQIPIQLEKYYKILIAVSEAVNNAIIHGNKLDKHKKVKVDINANKEKIEILVEDEGTGFDVDSLADPRIPENMMKESGRGVLLIKELSDIAKFNKTENGYSVFMVFFLGDK